MAATIGKLNVQLTSNTARFRSDMSRAGKGVDGLKKRLGGLDKAMAIYRAGMASMATAAAAATAASAAMVKRQMGTIDALGKTSAKLGIEVAELQRLHHAAELTGASIETVNMSLQRMSRRLAEAARGTGEARGVLGELGLDPKKLVAASPGTAFREIADRLGKVKTQYDKLRIAQKLFDSEGVALVNTLALGKRGLVAAGKEADRLGVTLAPGATGKVEAANDSLHRLKTALAGAANAITADVAPAITVLANEMARLAANMNKVGAAGGFIDKVADESVGTTEEEVLEFITGKEHPALAMDPMF